MRLWLRKRLLLRSRWMTSASFLPAMRRRWSKAGHQDIALTLEALDAEALYSDLEQFEQRLTAIEEKLIARLKSSATEEELFEARRSLDLQLKPYRGKMPAEQLSMLEKQFLERRLLDAASFLG